ncbi:MAG: protein BatD [Flavobacteriales bacterium]|nr:protein BatD [Flavobacteriales bacterium]
MVVKLRLAYLFVLLGMLFSIDVAAQKLTASAPSQVQMGQRFRVTWELNAGGSEFVAPEITDFHVLGGPNQSTSMQYINGSMSQSISFSYILQPKKEGEFTIGPAKIKSGGNTVTSNEITVRVVQGQQQASAQPSTSGQQQQQTEVRSGSDKDLFARVILNKRNVYLGEEITATLKFYTRVSIVDFENWDLPSYEGFWTKSTRGNEQIQMQNEVIDGIMYQTGVIDQIILYPQKTGEITIEPMELTAVVRERAQGRGRSIFDQFFGGYQDYKKVFSSEPVTVTVKPYPTAKPADFCGLTGKLQMKASLDKAETKSNEAVNLKVTVSGDGNLYQLQPLNIDFPPDIEVYDPKTSDNIKANANGISGSRTFEYVLIPRYSGDFKIGPFSLSYFDPSSKSFKTITQEAFDLIVEKGEGEDAVNPAVNITNKEDIKLIGSDIRYIKQGQYPILSGTTYFYRSVPFFAAMGIPLLLFFLLLGYVQYQKSQGKDVVRLKSKKATGLAKKRLTKAKKLWDEQKTAQFYEEVFKALSDYSADKFAIPRAELNKERIRLAFASRNVPEETINGFLGVLDKTEFARFAPGADKQMESVYDEALQAIVNVENHA